MTDLSYPDIPKEVKDKAWEAGEKYSFGVDDEEEKSHMVTDFFNGAMWQWQQNYGTT